MAKSLAQECPHMKAAASDGSGSETQSIAGLPEPPSPSIPPWKLKLRFLSEPFRLISDARKECGDIFLLEGLPGLGRVVFLCRAELLHEVYKRSEEEVVAGEIRGRHLAALAGDKVSLCLDGLEFKERRKVVAPFLNGKGAERHLPQIVGFTEQVIDQLEPGAEVELQPHFDRLTQKTIISVLFGARESEQIEHFSDLAHRFLEAFQWRTVQIPFTRVDLGPWSPWRRFLKRRKALSDALETEARRIAASEDENSASENSASENSASENSADLMAALIEAGLYEDPEESIEAVVQEMVGLVIGGAETTSKALSWCLLGLLTHPEALNRLRLEIDEVLGQRPMEAADLKQLPYLSAVIHEGLRHQSVGPFAGPRLAKKEITVGGYRITPGTAMVQALHEVGRCPIFPDAEVFAPEHFYGRDVKQRDWVPFGGGTRKCTGMGLALVELAAVTGTIVQRLDLKMGDGSTEPTQAGIAHKPTNNMRVRVVGRRA